MGAGTAGNGTDTGVGTGTGTGAGTKTGTGTGALTGTLTTGVLLGEGETLAVTGTGTGALDCPFVGARVGGSRRRRNGDSDRDRHIYRNWYRCGDRYM
jgi:hypothetical protein